MIPEELLYTETHEWVKLQGDTAVIGISDHAQDSLGDITFVELPQVGSQLEKGKECGVIESVKAASDIYSPVRGEVSEINEDLESEPEKINSSPYQEGWLYKVKNIDTASLDSLMDADAYKQFLEKNA
ncbi:MAG: glycine cleavage system protein GcvH [Chitinivibrionales bacterium]